MILMLCAIIVFTHGVRVLREWLAEHGYEPDELLSFEDDERPYSRTNCGGPQSSGCVSCACGRKIAVRMCLILSDEEVVLSATQYSIEQQ